MSNENFVVAYKVEDSLSFVLKGEPFYGQMYGPNAFFDERCTGIAIEYLKPESVGELKARGGFQFWEAITFDNGFRIELLTNSSEINSIIDEHASDSSVRPGDPEVIFWGGVRNGAQELTALAVLVKWQSGYHVMASVVTRSEDRGQGFATKLSAGMISHAHSLGISEIALGVRENNLAAKRAYEKAGFKKIADFTYYSQE